MLAGPGVGKERLHRCRADATDPLAELPRVLARMVFDDQGRHLRMLPPGRRVGWRDTGTAVAGRGTSPGSRAKGSAGRGSSIGGRAIRGAASRSRCGVGGRAEGPLDVAAKRAFPNANSGYVVLASHIWGCSVNRRFHWRRLKDPPRIVKISGDILEAAGYCVRCLARWRRRSEFPPASIQP
jgi:hypothetical protein